jgi:uncharacterized SAM-binding protein YcdF (DUF218 family)
MTFFKNIDKKRLISGLIILPLSAILCSVFISPMTVRIINAGNIAGVLFCAVIALAWLFYPLIKRGKKRFLTFKIFAVLFALGLCYAAFLSVNMLMAMRDEPKISAEKERTVIILGCQIRGDYPSFMLARRLEAARDYLIADENAVCVVTGGVGTRQTRSEACVMRDWLTANGIAEERIFLEELSTSTAENIAFAYEIIVENDLPRDVIIVSDGFHLWRGRMIAKKYFDEVGSVAARTHRYVLPTYWVREWLALTQEIFFA